MTKMEAFKACWNNSEKTVGENVNAMGPAVIELNERVKKLEATSHEHVIDGASTAAIKAAKIEVLQELRRWESAYGTVTVNRIDKMLRDLGE